MDEPGQNARTHGVRLPTSSSSPHPVPRPASCQRATCASARHVPARDATLRQGAGYGGMERDDSAGPRPRPLSEALPINGAARGAAQRLRSLPISVVQQKAKVCPHAACRIGGRPLRGAVNLHRNQPVRLLEPGAITGQILSAIRKFSVARVQHAAWKRHARVRRTLHSVNREKEAKLRGGTRPCLHRVS